MSQSADFSHLFPPLYHPSDVNMLYVPRVTKFVEAAMLMYPYAKRVRRRRRVKNGLIIVDPQQDFMHNKGSLFVEGSPGDLQRIIEFIYRNVLDIDEIYVSLDTHSSMQIFSTSWWIKVGSTDLVKPFRRLKLGSRPYWTVDAEDETQYYALRDQAWSRTYLELLQEPHMIWPEHCIVGTPGYQFMAAFVEVITFWSIVNKRDVTYIFKGICPQVEHFGIYGAEVPYPDDPQTFLNIPLLENMKQKCDYQYYCGVAKSHCVRKSEWQAMHYYPKSYRKRIIHLDDASSSVIHPEQLFELNAERDLDEMVSMGLKRMKTTDPIMN